jgi:peptidylprolyl isomerase
MTLPRSLVVLVALVFALAACGGDDDAAPSTTAAGADGGATTTTVAGDPSTTTAAGPVDDIVDDGDLVAVHYTGTLDDGTEFDSSRDREPLEFVVGSGQVIPGFDDAVRGLEVGDTTTVRIPSDQAYGDPDPEAIIEFPIDDVPEEFRVEGMQVMVGNGIPATVIEVTEDTVTIDANHPLAGQALTFEIEIVSVG